MNASNWVLLAAVVVAVLARIVVLFRRQSREAINYHHRVFEGAFVGVGAKLDAERDVVVDINGKAVVVRGFTSGAVNRPLTIRQVVITESTVEGAMGVK